MERGMMPRVCRTLSWWFLASLALAASVLCAESFTGRVVGVHDGDTLTVLVDERHVKVRLQGIDAPELAQSFGQQSRQALSALVFGQTVVVEVVDLDRYHRTVAHVSVLGRDVGAVLVRAGLAWWYQRYAPDDDALRHGEADARAQHRGLWRDAAPMAPWDWRRASAAARATNARR
jgi:micrococcal nuclease